MSKTLFLEPFSGLSGDMLNGLLLDLGADQDLLLAELKKLPVQDFQVQVEKIAKSSIYGTDFDVMLPTQEKDTGMMAKYQAQIDGHHHEHDHHHEHHHEHHHDEPCRNLADIYQIIDASTLSNFVKSKSKEVFLDIAQAEANVHQRSIADIHFHEVGALDSIVDIISFFILLEQLDIIAVYSLPVIEGAGTIKVAHGVMPVPVPAVMQLRQGTSILFQQDFSIQTELVTPTGLALFKALKPDFNVPTNLTIGQVGYGFGKKDTGKFNALRGSFVTLKHSKQTVRQTKDMIYQLEANIDDQTPEQLGYVFELLLEAGALDVFYTPVQMKKNRPGVVLTVLVKELDKNKFIELLLQETSTIGVRQCPLKRTVMKRTFKTVETEFGAITVKVNHFDGVTKQTLEYDECAKIAEDYHLPIKEVYRLLEQSLN